MLIKIANEFEVNLKDIVCVINLDKKEDKINKELLSKNKNALVMCDKEYRSLVIVRKNKKNILYLSPYTASAINKKRILF